MFVNIVEMPAIRRRKEKEFREWFEWSNALLQKSHGWESEPAFLQGHRDPSGAHDRLEFAGAVTATRTLVAADGLRLGVSTLPRG